MKFVKTLLVSAALVASVGAQAQVVGSLGGGFGSFLTLSTTGLSNGATPVATLTGGTVYTADQPFADIPKGGVFGGTFLAAGPTSGAPATLAFAGGVSYISFLWGSPDTYNLLTVTTTAGTQTFAAGASSGSTTGLNFAVTNGNQSFSQYVQFAALGTSKITSLSFNNVPSTDAFETANYSVTPVPEPETYALMLAGLGAMAFVARRRKSA